MADEDAARRRCENERLLGDSSNPRGKATHANVSLLSREATTGVLAPSGHHVVAEDAAADEHTALVVLKYNLAQNELREMVHALFGALEDRERQVHVCKDKIVAMRDKQERWKQDTLVELEQARRHVLQSQHNMTRMNQQIQDLQTQNDEWEAEKSMLNAQLDEKNATIEQLNQQLAALISKQTRAQQRAEGNVLACELKHVVNDFSRTEREVYSNMLYAEYRGYIDQESRLSESRHSESRPASLDAEQISQLEREKAGLVTENQTLLMRCKHLSDQVQGLKDQLVELTQVNEAHQKLIARFEKSAEDGTQTIQCLQNSLMKLCDQVTSERAHHGAMLDEVVAAAREKEHQLTQQADDLQTKLAEIQTNAEIAHFSMVLQQATAQREGSMHEANVATNDSAKKTRHERRGFENTKANKPSKARAPKAVEMIENTDCIEEIPDEIEDADDDDGAVIPLKLAPKTLTAPHIEKKQPTLLCRICGEEPFGFMINCQMCTDPFHASCVKPVNGKRRISHVFKCSSCIIQRPTKVSRRQMSSSSSKPDGALSTVSSRPVLP